MANMELEPISRESRPRELAYRQTDGLQVQLSYRQRKTGHEVLLHVIDAKEDQDFEVSVPPEKALDAFYHPYTYQSLGSLVTESQFQSAA